MRPSERLTAFVLILLSAVTAVSGAAGAGPRLLVFAALLGALLVLARAGAVAGLLAVLRDAAPGVIVLVVFLLLQPIIEAVNPVRLDETLAAADARWFAPVAQAWRGALGRPWWFTDLVYAAYWSYYLLPISVAVMARRRHGEQALEQVMFTLLVAFYLSFLGYFLWPTSGPRVPEVAEAAVLGGGGVSEAVRWFLRSAEATTLDAFPSGHTGISLVSLVLGARLFPRARAALALWTLAVTFATVYISVHYVVDVVGGVALAGLTLLLVRPAGLGDRLADTAPAA